MLINRSIDTVCGIFHSRTLHIVHAHYILVWECSGRGPEVAIGRIVAPVAGEQQQQLQVRTNPADSVRRSTTMARPTGHVFGVGLLMSPWDGDV